PASVPRSSTKSLPRTGAARKSRTSPSPLCTLRTTARSAAPAPATCTPPSAAPRTTSLSSPPSAPARKRKPTRTIPTLQRRERGCGADFVQNSLGPSFRARPGVRFSSSLRPRKNRFRQHHVHALVSVHQFRDVQVRRHACQHVRIVPRKMLFGHQEIDHLPHRHFRGFIQVFV